MFQRLIRVILSAQVDGFVGGMHRAAQSLRSFVSGAISGFGSVGAAVTGLQSAFNMLVGAGRGLVGAFDSIFGGLIRLAGGTDRWRRGMTAVVGDAGKVAEIEAMLTEKTLALGGSMDEARFASQQMAFSLQAMFGEVDPSRLEELLDLMFTIQAARPDIRGGMAQIGKSLASALSGDFTSLAFILDLPLKKIQEVLGLQGDVMENAEQQLGQVTRLGVSAAESVADPIAAVRAILEQAGIDAEYLAAVTSGPAADIDRMAAAWQHLKQVAAEAFLPSLIEGMTKLTALVEEHRPELEKFAAKLGEIAGMTFEGLIDMLLSIEWDKVIEGANNAAQAVKDFLSDPQTQKDAEQFIADIKEIVKSFSAFTQSKETAEALETLKDALAELNKINLSNTKTALMSIDWEAVAISVNAVAQAFAFLVTSYKSASDFFTDQADDGKANGSVPLFHGGGQDGTQAPQLPSGKSIQMGGRDPDKSASTQVDVNVTVSVDGQGSIVPFVQAATRQVIGELVAATSKSGKRST